MREFTEDQIEAATDEILNEWHLFDDVLNVFTDDFMRGIANGIAVSVLSQSWGAYMTVTNGGVAAIVNPAAFDCIEGDCVPVMDFALRGYADGDYSDEDAVDMIKALRDAADKIEAALTKASQSANLS